MPKVDGVSFSVEELTKRQAVDNEVKIYAPAYEGKQRRQRRGKVVVERFPSVSAPTYKDAHIAFPNFLKLLREVKKWDPDVIHVHTPMTMGLVGMIVARRLNKPVVGTYHTLVSELLMYLVPKWAWGSELKAQAMSLWKDLVGEGKGNGFLGGFIETLKSMREVDKSEEREEPAIKRVTWFLVNKFFNYCDAIIAPSDVVKRELLKRGMTKEVEVISNGIDATLFSVKKTFKKGYKILHVGRMGFEKKVDEVIRAFELVHKEIPAATLTLVGDGPAKNEWETLVKSMGLDEVITFTGWEKRENLGRVYRGHDVFVTASTMETQGLVVLEAMASGLAVVGVNKFAVGDIVRSGKNGYLVRPGDYVGMAVKMVKILREVKLKADLGREARKTAEGHDIGETVKKIRNLYLVVMEKRRLANGGEVGAGFAEE